MSDHYFGQITFTLREIVWTYLHQLDIDNAFRDFTTKRNYVIQIHAPERVVTIKLNIIIFLFHSLGNHTD